MNDSKRIQSYIRNLMVGQFKSTIICGTCSKVSICFDPYMLISLPIPTSRESSLFFVTSLMDAGAIKISIEVNKSTSLQSLGIELAKTYNSSYNREIREGTR